MWLCGGVVVVRVVACGGGMREREREETLQKRAGRWVLDLEMERVERVEGVKGKARSVRKREWENDL